MPLAYAKDRGAVILRVGESPDRVWHFWSASPQALLPGHLQGCTAKAQVRISRGALLQMGSDWYFPSTDWQDAVFTDVGHH